MAKGDHNRWVTVGAHLYYWMGAAYYAYHWLIIAGGLGILATALGTYFLSWTGLWWAVGALSVVTLGAGLLVYFYNWRARYRNINAGLKIMVSHSVYTIMASGHYQYWRELTVVAATDGVDHFTHLFNWTGQGNILPSAPNGFHPELSDDPLSAKRRLRIYFDRPRRKGERFVVQYQMDMTDTGARARPFLRTTMHEKARRIVSEVRFEGTDCPERYTRSIFMSDVAEIPVHEEVITVNRGETSLAWEVKKPRLDYSYRISW